MGPGNQSTNIFSFKIKEAGKDYVLIQDHDQFRFEESNSLLVNYRKLAKIVSPSKLVSLMIKDFIKSYQIDLIPISEINPNLQTQSFSDIDLQLKKNLYKYPLVYNKFGEKYNNILSAARYTLANDDLKCAFDIIMYYINPEWSEGTYMSFVKDFGTYLLEKVINKNYPLYLLNFVEIHMLSGYDTYLHRKFDIKKDVLPFSISRSIDPEYDALFKKNITKTIDMIDIAQYPKANFDDFVKYRDNWNLMGSATIGQPMKIKTDGFRKASRIASKTTNLLYYDDKTLLEQLRLYRGHVIKPFLKTDEAAKSRVVIGYDTRSYIRCSFLELFIQNFNGIEKWTTVGDDPQTLYQIREQVNENIKSKKYRMICTDQSAFDQHQYKHLFIYAFNTLCQRIERLNPQVKEIRELENYGMNNAKIYLPDGSTLPWKNGLLSGHKFTALIGSILNRSATMTALQISNCAQHFGVFQGDDALLFMDKDADYNSFLDAYKKLDLVVNPMKSWHGLDRTEYLHQVYIKNMVIALPLRAQLGLYFKDPKSLDVAMDQVFNATIDQYRMARRRGLNVDNLALSYVRDFLRHRANLSGNKLVHESYNYLHTPTLYSGGGFEPYVDSKYYRKIVFSKEMTSNAKSHIITPYHYRINGDPILTEEWIFKKIYAHLPQPNIKTTASINRIDFTKAYSMPHTKVEPEKIYYDPLLSDNTDRWYKHCLSSINRFCIYGDKNTSRFNRVRSRISESFNLISNVTNAFIGFLDNKIWNNLCSKVMGIYSTTRVSLDRLLSYMQNIREKMLNQYRTKPPDWYNYGFYF